MNRIPIQHIKTIVLSVISTWALALFDQHAMVVWHPALQLYPVLLLSIYFFARYSEVHWVAVASSVLIYGIVTNVPVWLMAVLFLSILLADSVIQSHIQRVTIVYLTVMSVIVSVILHLIMKATPVLLAWQGWVGIQGYWSTYDLRDSIVKIVVTTVLLFLTYPLLSAIESKQKIYTSFYR